MLENGGGDGSMSVISPALFAEYGVPYDRQTTAALHDIGIKVVYHTCGKMMAQLELLKQIGADASETLTPRGMGGDVDLRRDSRRRWAADLCLIGGFNQQAGFELRHAGTSARRSRPSGSRRRATAATLWPPRTTSLRAIPGTSGNMWRPPASSATDAAAQADRGRALSCALRVPPAAEDRSRGGPGRSRCSSTSRPGAR